MADEKIKVDISSRFPIFIEANADAFGEIFAHMADDDQLRVLGAMVEHMKPHKLQWDYLALKLEKDEHRELRDQLRYVLFPTDAPYDLMEALKDIASPRDCGCSPVCQCDSAESLRVEVDHMRDTARAAIAKSEAA